MNYLFNFSLEKSLINFYFILLIIQVLGIYTIPSLFNELLIFIILFYSIYEVLRKGIIKSNITLLYIFLTPIYIILGIIIYQNINVTFLKDLSLFLIFILVYEKNFEKLLSHLIKISYTCLPIFLIALFVEVNNVEFSVDSFRDIQDRNVSLINYAYIIIILNPLVKTNYFFSFLKYVFLFLFMLLCIKTLTLTGLIISLFALINDIYRFNKKISLFILISLLFFAFFYSFEYLNLIVDRLYGVDFYYSQNPRIYEIIYFFNNVNYLLLLFGLGIGSLIDNPFYGILPFVTSDKIDMIHIGYFHLIFKGGLIMLVTFIILQYRVLKINFYTNIITLIMIILKKFILDVRN